MNNLGKKQPGHLPFAVFWAREDGSMMPVATPIQQVWASDEWEHFSSGHELTAEREVAIQRDDLKIPSWTVVDTTDLGRFRIELQHHKNLLDRLPVGVYQATPGLNGVILQANPALLRIFDIPADDQLVGRRVADFYANPEERAALSERVLQNGSVYRNVHRARTDSGRLIWIAITSRATQLSDGSLILEGAVEDVTELREAELKLDRASARATNALDAAPIPMMMYTAAGRIEAVNCAWCEASGYTPGQLATLEDWTRLAYGTKADDVLQCIRSMIQKGRRVAQGDFQIRRADGDVRTWSFFSGPLEFEGETPTLFLSAAIDVTERRAQEHRMRRSEAIIQSAHEGITITDPDGNIEQVNAAFTRITGYSESEVRGRNPRLLSSGRQDKAFYENMWSSINEKGYWRGEIWNRRKNGEIYPELLSITEIRDADDRLVNYAAVFTDLTELKQTQADVDQLQHYDSLTGLMNRRWLLAYLGDSMTGARQEPRKIAILVCGLDRFRMINESFSYLEGDRILKTVAQRLQREQDQHIEIGRPSSDHFVLVINSGANRSRILDLADRIAQTLAKPIATSKGQKLNVQCSIGIARFPRDGKTPGELLRNAETAMFFAKQIRPGSHAFYSSDQLERAQRKLELENRIRQVLDERTLEFHLQPVVSVAHGHIVGAEALARWPVSDEKPVTPDTFIPVAEQSGMIGRLSFQLLESSARAAVEIQSEFSRDFVLAFNISALSFNDQQFDQKILECLASVGLKPSRFELELTESTLMEQALGSARVLKRLRDAGIRLSIDDFGTGFSSLAYLQEMDAHVLKIDRRFTSKVATHPADAQITSSIIAMAHALGMEVIAEGVETTEQLDFLRRQKCDFYQGYLFSKPLPLNDFKALYRSCLSPESD